MRRQRILKMLLPVLIVVLLFFVAFAALLYFLQGSMIFHPSRSIEVTPDELGLTFKDVFIDVTDSQAIHAWYFRSESNAGNKTILFCHGNAGNISHRLETVRFWLDLGCNVLLFDYRGYGRSPGKPTEANVYADATAAYNWLIDQEKAPAGKIVIFGRSLGGAVAIDLAGRVDCAGLIVESSFTSVPDLGQKMYPFMPIRLLARYRFDSLGKIRRVRCPVLVAHSSQDDLIPYEMGRDLYEAAPEPKQFVEFRGGHNDREYLETENYRQRLQEFIGSLVPAGD